MQVADLILPVFAVIVTGWLAGYLGYVARDLSDALIHFAYNVAMPALLIVTIAHEPARSLLAWRFLIAFGGGSLLCFAIVFTALRAFGGQGVAGAAMQGWAASMTNTGFVALPVLQATYGPRAVLPAAIATMFVAVIMFPAAVLMQELDPHGSGGSVLAPWKLARHVTLNPMVLSTLVGIAWAAAGVPMPGPVNAYLDILANALTACALFAIGLGVSMDGHPHRGCRVRGGSDRQDGLHPFRRISLRGINCRGDRLSHDVVLDRHAHRLDLCFDEVFSVGVTRRPASFADLKAKRLPRLSLRTR
jgi:malonate transporter